MYYMSKSYPEDDLEPLGGLYINNVTVAMEKWFKDKDNLIIDGIMISIGDCKKIVREWPESIVTFMEMEPNEKHVKELVKWKGKEFRMVLHGHENYDLAMFIKIMNDWPGNTLVIGQCGPQIFTKEVALAFSKPKYKNLCFDYCDFTDEFLQLVKETVPELNIIIQ